MASRSCDPVASPQQGEIGELPCHVVHVIAPALVGGAEAVLQALLAGTGGRAHLAALLQDQPPQPLVARLRDTGVPVSEIHCGRRRYWREVRAVERLLSTHDARAWSTATATTRTSLGSGPPAGQGSRPFLQRTALRVAIGGTACTRRWTDGCCAGSMQ